MQQRKFISPKENIDQVDLPTPEKLYIPPSTINRFTASFIDNTIVIVLSIILLFSLGLGLLTNSHYSSMVSERRDHSISAQLTQLLENSRTGEGVISYTTRNVGANEFMARIYPADDDMGEFYSTRPRDPNSPASAVYSDYRIIQTLAYFYCTYLAGDETSLRINDLNDDGLSIGTPYSVNPDSGAAIKYGEVNVLPTTFNIEWFNRNILEYIPEDSDSRGFKLFVSPNIASVVASPRTDIDLFWAGKDIFPVANTSLKDQASLLEDDVNYALGAAYFTETANSVLMDFFASKYSVALATFAELPYILSLEKEMFNISHYAGWTIISVVFLLYFLVFPLIRKKGETLGRLIFKIGVVNRSTGLISKKWQTVVRFVPYLLVLVLGFLLKYDLIVFAVLAALYLVDIALILLSKTQKLSFADYLSNTVLADYAKKILFPNYSALRVHLDVEAEIANRPGAQGDINPIYDSRIKK